ncbi:hypothetical protein JCM11251_001570 [Rhodosporidiobolus azoricus]
MSASYDAPHPLASLSTGSAHLPHSFPPSSSHSHGNPLVGTPTAPHAARSLEGTATSAHASSAANGIDGGMSKKRKVDTGGSIGGTDSGHGGHQESPGSAERSLTGVKKRQTLSCTECKRRKIKCDRKARPDYSPIAALTPFSTACCKRGDPSSCRWSDETPVKEPDVQPFALTGDLLKLASRLQALEEWANQLPPEVRSNAPPPVPQVFRPGLYTAKVKPTTKERLMKEKQKEDERLDWRRTASMHESPEDALSRDVSDTEDAVVRLESIAFSARPPNSHYRPQDSLPFYGDLDTYSTYGTPSTLASRAGSSLFAELTPMRTSIVAYIVYEGPWTSAAQGFDLCFSLEELKAARGRTLDNLWPYMPGKELSFKLVEKYFVEIAFLHTVYHRETFEAEHIRAWEMVEAGRRDEIDPMWLAGWAMICALAIDGLRCAAPRIDISPEHQKHCHPMVWYSCAIRFMLLGEGLGRPQVRFIQVSILVGQWLQSSNIVGQASRYVTILAAAIRSAQILGLHLLKNDPSHMPPPDPAWPPNPCSLRRETALRLFGILSFLDWISSTTRFNCSLLDPKQCTTPPLSNLNLNQLSITDWKVEPHPHSTLTDSSFESAKFALCMSARETQDRLRESAETFSYDTVMELDAKYRKVVDELDLAVPSAGQSADEPTQRWKRMVCQEGTHSRIVRLHRPFMAKHDYSRRVCVDSAEKVIRADLNVIASTNNAWFTYSHALGSAIVLFADLFMAIDEGVPETDIDRKKEILVLAFNVFSRCDDIPSAQLRSVVQTGSRILGGLFLAEEKRRVTRAAAALVPGGRSNEPPLESFAAVLQRLTLEVAGPPAPAASPPPISAAALPSPHPQMQFVPTMHSNLNPSFADPTSGAPAAYSSTDNPLAANDSQLAGFFRDVGLTGSSTFGLGTSFNLPMGPGGFGDGLQQPLGGLGAGPTLYDGGGDGPAGLPPVPDWFFGSLDGETSSSVAATALLDQLSGGVW